MGTHSLIHLSLHKITHFADGIFGFQKEGSNVTNQPEYKQLGDSGTFVAQLFERWTLESATRDQSMHGPLHNQCW